jgi:hypothetical protein
MKTLRIVMLTAALAVGGMGSAYARDSFGLSVNIGIPGYYAAPPAVVYQAPPAVVYYEPEPVRYYYGAPTRIYYSEPRYYGHDHKWRGNGHKHHRHHHHGHR